MSARRAADKAQATAKRMRAARLVIVTGISGSGKSQAIRALEDLGYFCVDNLPVELLPTLAELTLRSGSDMPRAAVVIDVREGAQLAHFPAVYAKVRQAGRPAPAADLPRRERGGPRPALQRDEAAAPAGADAVAAGGLARRAQAARRHPKAGRRAARHHRHDRARTAAGVHEPLAGDHGTADPRRDDAEFRVQARAAGRRRPRLRRPLPAQPALRPGVAAAHGARRAHRAVPRPVPGDGRVPRTDHRPACSSCFRTMPTRARAT